MATSTRHISRLLALVVFAILSVSPSGVSAVENGVRGAPGQVEYEESAPKPVPPRHGEAAGSEYVLGPGDRLRVTFHERLDLSGEFRVRPDGLISLPFIGTLRANGYPVAEVETDIAEAFQQATKQAGYVSVEVVEWRPIYVAGFVNKPGAYPFAPGVAVLHAVALAGGTYRPAGTISPIELSREKWRGANARLDLERAIARLARTKAERDRRDSVETPDELVKLAGQDRARELIAAEEQIFQIHREAAQKRTDGFQRMEQLTRDEVEAQKKQLGSLRDEEAVRRQDLEETSQLRDRGLTSRTLVYNARYGLSAHMAHISEIIAEIAEAERELAQISRDRTIVGMQDWQSGQEKVIAIENEIAELKRTISSWNESVRLMDGGGLGASDDEPSAWDLDYRIMRRDGQEYKVLRAAADTQLLPGDVLHVGRPAAGPEVVDRKPPRPPGSGDPKAVRPAHSSRSDAPDLRQPTP